MNWVPEEVAICLDVFTIVVIMTLIMTSGAALPLQIILVHGHPCLFFEAYFCGAACIWVLRHNEKVEAIGFSNHHCSIAIGNSNQ